MNTSSLARLARRRTARKRNTEMAPVRRTLVATWIGEGSSVEAKMEGVDGGSSIGPSSGAAVDVVSGTWASHVSGPVRGRAETWWRLVGL